MFKRNYFKGGYLIRIDESTLSSKRNLKIDSDCVSCTLLTLGFPRDVVDSVLESRHELKDHHGRVIKKGIKINKLVDILNDYLYPFEIIKPEHFSITNNYELTSVLRYIYSEVLIPGTISFISYNYRRSDGQLGGHMMLVAKTKTPTYYLIDARAPRDQNPEPLYSQADLNFEKGSPIFNFFDRDVGVLASKGTVINKITTYQSYEYTGRVSKNIHEHPSLEYDFVYDSTTPMLTKTLTSSTIPEDRLVFHWRPEQKLWYWRESDLD